MARPSMVRALVPNGSEHDLPKHGPKRPRGRVLVPLALAANEVPKKHKLQLQSEQHTPVSRRNGFAPNNYCVTARIGLRGLTLPLLKVRDVWQARFSNGFGLVFFAVFLPATVEVSFRPVLQVSFRKDEE